MRQHPTSHGWLADAEKGIGWHRSGGQWQYTHKRAMSDAAKHPANKEALKPDVECVVPPSPTTPPVVNGGGNGLFAAAAVVNGEGEAGAQAPDHISLKLTEMKVLIRMSSMDVHFVLLCVSVVEESADEGGGGGGGGGGGCGRDVFLFL